MRKIEYSIDNSVFLCYNKKKKVVIIVRIGICTAAKIENIEKIKACGADYIEVGFRDIMKFSEEEALEIKRVFDEAGVGIEAANCMLDSDLPIVVAEPKLDLLAERLERSFKIAKILGIKVVVLGSGGARNIPEGSTKEEATARFIKVAKDFLPEFFEKYDMTCVIEPLQTKDSTLINTLAEGYEVVEGACSSRIQLLGDLFHMDVMGDSVEEVLKYKDCLKHTHLANEKGNRCYPAPDDGNVEHYKAFFEALRKIDYQGRVSIEANAQGEFFETATKAVALLKSL